jgi:hypothetical protein
MKFNDLKKSQEKKVSTTSTINYQKYTSNPNFFGSKIFNNYKSNKFRNVDSSQNGSSKAINISNDKEIYLSSLYLDEVSNNFNTHASNFKLDNQNSSLNLEMNIDLLKSKIERLTKLAKGLNKSNNTKSPNRSQEIIRNNYNTNNCELKYYTHKNIPLQNSKIPLNLSNKNSRSPVRKVDVSSEINKFNFNSKLLKGEQLSKSSNKSKMNYNSNRDVNPLTNKNKTFSRPIKKKQHLNLIIQQVEEISINPTRISIINLNKSDLFSPPFSNILTDEDNLVEDFLKIRSSLKNSFIENNENLINQDQKIFEKLPSPTNKKIMYNEDSRFKNIIYFTDKDRKTISKIYKNEKVFDPEELLLQYRCTKISTDKKERSLVKLLKEFNKSRREDEEIDFVISDLSYDPSEGCNNEKMFNPNNMKNFPCVKIESNSKQFKSTPPTKIKSSKKYKNESEEENQEKHTNPFEINQGVRKNLSFSENLDSVFSDNDNGTLQKNSNEKRNNCFNNISSIKFLKANTPSESDFKNSSIKNYLKSEPEKNFSPINTSNKNTEFIINQSTNSTSFSNTSLSKKKVTFLDDTTVYNYDRKKVVNYLTYQNLYKSGIKNKKALNKSTSLYKSKINITAPYNKNAPNSKLKSILIKRDSSFTATYIDITSVNEKDKSEALEKLNQLIQELELEEGRN